MGKLSTVSAKIPDDIYREFKLRVSEGNRSAFIRDAILEKLQKTPRPEKLLEVENRVRRLEVELSEVKKSLTKLFLKICKLKSKDTGCLLTSLS